MNYFIFMKIKGMQWCLSQDNTWNRTINTVMPGTPRDPFSPPGIARIFDSEEEAAKEVAAFVETNNHPGAEYKVLSYDKGRDVFALLRNSI